VSQGLLEDPHHERSDLVALAKAIKRGWPVDEKLMKTAIDKCAAIMASGKERYVLGAIKCIQTAHRQNLKTVEMFQDHKPQVIINNNIGQRDTLTEFLEMLSPDEQTEWLNRYGAGLVQADGGSVSSEPAT